MGKILTPTIDFPKWRYFIIKNDHCLWSFIYDPDMHPAFLFLNILFVMYHCFNKFIRKIREIYYFKILEFRTFKIKVLANLSRFSGEESLFLLYTVYRSHPHFLAYGPISLTSASSLSFLPTLLTSPWDYTGFTSIIQNNLPLQYLSLIMYAMSF